MQENAPDYPENVLDSTGKSCVAFAWYDREACCWRTWQRCLDGEWERFLETWPDSGTTRNGIAYRLATLVPHTAAQGSLLWPTLNVVGWRSDGELKLLARMVGAEEFRLLSDRACESKRRRWYPTLSASDYKGSYKPGQRRGQLTEAIQHHGKLNPEWAEWLMGFPIGHTALED